MKIELEQVSPIRKKMTVVLPSELVDKEVDKAYSKPAKIRPVARVSSGQGTSADPAALFQSAGGRRRYHQSC